MQTGGNISRCLHVWPKTIFVLDRENACLAGILPPYCRAATSNPFAPGTIILRGAWGLGNSLAIVPRQPLRRLPPQLFGMPQQFGQVLERACPTIRSNVAGSFCWYTLPAPHSGQAWPGRSVACGIETLIAPENAVAPLRPCPRAASALSVESHGGGADAGFNSLSTAHVFSVLRFCVNRFAMA
jgi:hypothetical protein